MTGEGTLSSFGNRVAVADLFVVSGPGIYHGTLVFPSASNDLHPGDGVIDSASLVPYPSDQTASHSESNEQPANLPISMALTEWHFILLYEDKVRAIDLLSDKVVYEEALDLVGLAHSIFFSLEAETNDQHHSKAPRRPADTTRD